MSHKPSRSLAGTYLRLVRKCWAADHRANRLLNIAPLIDDDHCARTRKFLERRMMRHTREDGRTLNKLLCFARRHGFDQPPFYNRCHAIAAVFNLSVA
jgi:hypothetical protein